MLTGPTPATRKLLDLAKLKVDDIDLFELNEAFASVVLKYQKDLNIPNDKLNVCGGAIFFFANHVSSMFTHTSPKSIRVSAPSKASGSAALANTPASIART